MNGATDQNSFRRGAQDSRAGFTLVEVLIAVAVSGILLLAIGSFMDFYSRSSKKSQNLSTYQNILSSLRSAASAAYLVKTSASISFGGGAGVTPIANATVNPDLQHCLMAGSVDCNGSASGWQVLHLRQAIPSATIADSPTPIRYDRTGKICTASNADCMFEAYSYFKAYCSSVGGVEPATCDTAVNLDVKLVVSTWAGSPIQHAPVELVTSYQRELMLAAGANAKSTPPYLPTTSTTTTTSTTSTSTSTSTMLFGP